MMQPLEIGRAVSPRGRGPDGSIRIWLVGPFAAARELGLPGDQYMGWTGTFDPEQLEDIQVEEKRRD
jgi:hypothetical protein